MESWWGDEMRFKYLYIISAFSLSEELSLIHWIYFILFYVMHKIDILLETILHIVLDKFFYQFNYRHGFIGRIIRIIILFLVCQVVVLLLLLHMIFIFILFNIEMFKMFHFVTQNISWYIYKLIITYHSLCRNIWIYVSRCVNLK